MIENACNLEKLMIKALCVYEIVQVSFLYKKQQSACLKL